MNNIVDSIVVGQFVGIDALAAVGSTGSLVYFVIGFVSGLCSGFAIQVAYHFGAKDREGLRKTIVNIVYLCVGIGAILTVLTALSTKWILEIMNTPANISDEAYSYVIIIFAGLGATIFYNILAAISRALGDSRTPLYFLVMSAILNIALDLLFVLGLNLRAAGTAYATVLSQLIAGVCCFIYMMRKFSEIRIGKGNFKIHSGSMRHLLSVGTPMALQSSIMSIGTLILQSAINPLGSGVVASITAAGKVQSIITLPHDAIGVTMATYASQNLGARKVDRIYKGVKALMIMNLIISIAAFAVVNLFGTSISRLFITGDQPEIFAYIKQFLFASSLFYFALGFLNIHKNCLQGIGYTVPAMGSGLFELAARAIVALLFVGSYGFTAVCYANGAAWASANFLVIPLLYYMLAKLKKRIHAEEVSALVVSADEASAGEARKACEKCDVAC